MNNQPNNDFSFSSGNLLLFLYKWRKLLIIISASAALISAIVSLVIREKYKSTVILFPTRTNSISKVLLSENTSGKFDILDFGEEEQAEQMLQVLNSDEIRVRIIEKYNLMQHWDIDPNDQYKMTKLFNAYESNIRFKRTEFMSVKIDVMDYSPDTAALIANDIAALHDSVRNRMRKDLAKQAFEIVKAAYLDQKWRIQLMEDSLTKIRAMGVYSFESQAEVLSDQLGAALVKGNKQAAGEIEENLKKISLYGSSFISLTEQLVNEYKQLSVVRARYDEAKVDAEKTLETKFVVNHAFPAEKKSYPIRWLIVVVSTVATFLLTLFSIVLFESIKQVKEVSKE
ncbi:MAG: hypothetical protein HUU48_08020 [Flavobacteriales bacterium]|nr:hypothetical protein [Flavobacteriales bacterium]